MAKEDFLNPPSKQPFYKVMVFLLSVMTLNDGYWAFYKMPNNIYSKLQSIVVLYFVPTAIVSQVLYLVMNYSDHDVNTLAIIYTVLPVTFVLQVKAVIARTPSYKKAMSEFISQIHVFSYYCEKRESYVKDILIKAEKYTRISTYVLALLNFICTSAFLVVPIIHNCQKIDSIYNITARLEIMVHFYLPFDYEFNFYWYMLMQMITAYCVFFAVIVIVLFDINNLTFLYHLLGHIQILKHILKEEFKTTITQEEVKSKLIEVTKYYAFLRKIFRDVEKAFGVNIVAIYMHNLFGGGILMYQIMIAGANTETLLSFGLMIPIYMGELIIISLVLEDIRIQSDEISELVYNLRWEKMSIINQKLVLMILFQVQQSLEFKAAFNVKTGVQPAINSNEISELVYNLQWENMSIANQKMVLLILFQVQYSLEFKAAFNVKTGVQPAINIIKTAFSYYVMIKQKTM